MLKVQTPDVVTKFQIDSSRKELGMALSQPYLFGVDHRPIAWILRRDFLRRAKSRDRGVGPWLGEQPRQQQESPEQSEITRVPREGHVPWT